MVDEEVEVEVSIVERLAKRRARLAWRGRDEKELSVRKGNRFMIDILCIGLTGVVRVVCGMVRLSKLAAFEG